MEPQSMEETIDLSKYNYLFTTYATVRFLPILQLWLRTTCMQADAIVKGNSTANIRVYLGHDISAAVKKSLEDSFQNVQFIHIPIEVPEGGFVDYWASEHYAWKLWILNTISNETNINKNTVVTYFDCGAIMVKLPLDMYDKTIKHGICFIEDETQKNSSWTSDKCREIMKTTDEELAANQLLAAIITFRGGSDLVTSLLKEAYTYSLNRDCIAGPKWGNGAHRHDQAILSILRLRYSAPTLQLEKVVCHQSLRDTNRGGHAFYLHRGRFKVTSEVIPGITDSYVVNLERRADRYEEFKKNLGEFSDQVKVLKAVDGRSLKMTADLSRLFQGNDFMWKKGVVGCALSHLRLWYDLACEPAETKSYLVFEDDAKPRSQWLSSLKEAMLKAPADFDILYLGGVLPPNKPGLQIIKEPVSGSEPWNRVALNTAFGQRESTRYYHFCTYSYIISRQGARKLINIINDRGCYFTSADHMIVNNWNKLNIYFCDPLTVDCIQDEDPNYANSQFNNYNRVDTFDSDIWNQTDCFNKEEQQLGIGLQLNISAALHDIYPDVKIIKSNITSSFKNTITDDVLTVYMLNAKPDMKIMEQDWLEELLGRKMKIEKMPETSAELKPGQLIWVTCSRADLQIWTHIFKAFETEGRPFKVLHLSDEYGKDDISWYSLPQCKGVIRNYYRPECDGLANVVQIPLGYADGLNIKDNNCETNRDYIWSFEGTKWFNREEKLSPLNVLTPNFCKFYDQWLDPAQTSRSEYFARMKSSQFVPIVRGNHFETFRLYEVLEAKAIPIIIRDSGDDIYWKWLTDHIPLINLSNADDAKKFITHLMVNPQKRELYREGIVSKYNEWKIQCVNAIKSII